MHFADWAKERIYYLPIANFYQSKKNHPTQLCIALKRNSGKMKPY